jgi:hypothetical protein
MILSLKFRHTLHKDLQDNKAHYCVDAFPVNEEEMGYPVFHYACIILLLAAENHQLYDHNYSTQLATQRSAYCY